MTNLPVNGGAVVSTAQDTLNPGESVVVNNLVPAQVKLDPAQVAEQERVAEQLMRDPKTKEDMVDYTKDLNSRFAAKLDVVGIPFQEAKSFRADEPRVKYRKGKVGDAQIASQTGPLVICEYLRVEESRGIERVSSVVELYILNDNTPKAATEVNAMNWDQYAKIKASIANGNIVVYKTDGTSLEIRYSRTNAAPSIISRSKETLSYTKLSDIELTLPVYLKCLGILE